jgi:ribonuclease HI
MSAAAGITLIGEDERNPLLTTTYGVGELISHAIRENGCRKFIVGIGGSATNDGGVGMLSALGFKFLDREGREIPMGASGLASLDRIITDGAMPELAECEFHIACDVKNPLCGENGCSAIYGPQKGATEQMIKDMDSWLGHYAELTAKATGHDNRDLPGAGAAGGLGFAFVSYLGGSLESGIGLVMREIGLERELSGGEAETTNNRMELSAVIAALSALKEPCEVTLTTDSQYVVNAIEKGWLSSWQKNGWKKSGRGAVLNVDLWQKLVVLLEKNDVTFVWVRGHNGHPYNERCDKLATDYADSL